MIELGACTAPLTATALLAYWLGELGADAERDTETHLLGCAHCSAALEAIVELRDGVRALTVKGALRTVVTDAFVTRLVQTGVRVREYRVPANGSVNCAVGVDDDVVVARLEADLHDVERVDMLLFDIEGDGQERIEEVPVGAQRDSVLITARTEALRALPVSTARIRLLAVDAQKERVLGEYTFNHTPVSQ